MTNAKLIKGRWVFTGDEVIADAAVAIEGSRIIETGSAAALSRRYDGAEVIGSEHSAVLPGFVNAHHHSHGVSTIQHGCQQFPLARPVVAHGGVEPLWSKVACPRGTRTPRVVAQCLHGGYLSPEEPARRTPGHRPPAVTMCHRPQAPSGGTRRRWPRRASPSPHTRSPGTAPAPCSRSSAGVRPCVAPCGTGRSSAAGTGR